MDFLDNLSNSLYLSILNLFLHNFKELDRIFKIKKIVYVFKKTQENLSIR